MVDAVQGRCEVYLDSGVRRGTDVFKALALGARAVFIGRPMVYGLAYDVSIQTITTVFIFPFLITLGPCRRSKGTADVATRV